MCRPAERLGHHGGILAHSFGEDALRAARHLSGGVAGKGEQQDPARIGAAGNQIRHAMRQRIGLARAGASDDQQRTGFIGHTMRDGAPLVRIELVETSWGHVNLSLRSADDQ